MTARDLAKRDDSFPALSGNIEADTEAIIGELAVGTIVTERGMARLYLVWRSRGFLNMLRMETRCSSCGLEFSDLGVDDDPCPRCQGVVTSIDTPVFPTLETYLSYVADETGKSRQTLFNRLRVYRVLSDERKVDPAMVFELNLLSSGAASKLASASDDDPHLQLADNSWTETVNVALQQSSKGSALEYIKYDVLKEPKITTEQTDDDAFTVYREYMIEDDQSDEYIVEQFEIKIVGNWPDQMLRWIVGKLGAKAVT